MELISHLEEPAWASRYINALEAIGVPATAAKVAGVTKRMVLEYAQQCREFEYECEQAEERFNDVLELEAIRRARDGIDKPIYFKGELVGHERQYSDTLMSQLLKGRRARVYGDKKEVNFTGGVQVVLAPVAQLDSLPTTPAGPAAVPSPKSPAPAIEGSAVSIPSTPLELEELL